MGISSFKSGFTKTALPAATVTATTGSPSVDTTTRPGKTIYRFTGNGSITVGAAGSAEILVVGGGGKGGYAAGSTPGGGGGAGGLIYDTAAFLSAGTLTVTVGAGGLSTGGYSQSLPGAASALGSYGAPGGGGGGMYVNPNNSEGQTGGSGGGGWTAIGVANGTGLPGQGNSGASNGGSGYGGGGGAGGAATNGSRTGGIGRSISITGTAVTYAVGGDGGVTSGTVVGAAGAANTGNGGTGGGLNSVAGGNGGSGVVIVVIG